MDGDSPVWSIEQVVAWAGRSSRFAAGEAIAVPPRWSRTGASGRAVWGRYDGSSSEPYEVAVDHVHVVARCGCPSRVVPCKHVIGLLVLWVRGHVPTAAEPAAVTEFARRPGRTPPAAGDGSASDPGPPDAAGPPDDPAGPDTRPDGTPPGDRDARRDERIGRLVAGLVELDRWLEDRMRTGLADASVARFATWDGLAARLTDARAGALANRVRRVAGRVGASADWHAAVLAELGLLHLLAQAGQRVPALPPPLADTVAVACGWQVRTADVLAAAPETDSWLVAGRSDNREDLVEVRRHWLYGLGSRRWALVLSFAAYRQSLDVSLRPGTVVTADVHRYPGSSLRVIVGERRGEVTPGAAPPGDEALTVAGLCAALGRTLAAEPWLERVPGLVTATPAVDGHGWALTDRTGALAVAPPTPATADALAVVLAASAGRPVTLAVEWTADGLVPLTVFLPDRALDVGPRADASFVSAA